LQIYDNDDKGMSANYGLAPPGTTWHTIEVIVSGTNFNVYVDNTLCIDQTGTGESTGDNVSIDGWVNDVGYWDNFQVRKYCSPEPTWGTWGSEEYFLQTISPGGIASAEAFGMPTMLLYLTPSGIASLEAFGSPEVLEIIIPTGIASAEAFGAPVVAGPIIAVGIPSAEAFGTSQLNFTLLPPSLAGYAYRKQITINGTTAGAQTNYQMKLTVYKGTGTDGAGVVYLGGKCRDDFNDIRFTKSDGSTELDHWRESYVSGDYAVFWVEFDSIPASPSTANFYIYYDKADATSGSNGDNTFIFFDDFNDNSLDSNKWIKVLGGGTVDVLEQNQDLEIKSDGTNRAHARSLSSYTAPYILEVKAKRSEDIEVAVHWDGQISGDYDVPNNAYFAPIYASWGSPTSFVVKKFVAGAKTDLANYNIDLDTGWHVYKTIVKTDGIEVYYDGTLILSTTDITFTSGYLGLSGRETPAAINSFYDNVFTRKYCSPEPTWGTWGTEETLLVGRSFGYIIG